MTTLGKYELLESLGRGGYGTVYHARDTILDVDRAVKVLHPQLAADPDFIERFRREARTAARLKHPNIVQVYDLDEAGGRYFLAMEYLPGRSLKDVLEKQGRLPFERAQEIVRQVASALDYAHRQGLIHRDVKPGNILFEAEYTGDTPLVKLVDFGFAKALTAASSASHSASGGMIGTPAYMAPEIWMGQAASPASDVYSLACVFYETLTGVALFGGTDTPPPLVMKRHFDPLALPKQWSEGTPAGVEGVLRKALAREPDERYGKCGEFSAALASVKQDEIDRKEAEERAARAVEEKTQREVEEKKRREAEEKTQHMAVEKAQRDAEEKSRRESAERQQREAEEQKVTPLSPPIFAPQATDVKKVDGERKWGEGKGTEGRNRVPAWLWVMGVAAMVIVAAVGIIAGVFKPRSSTPISDLPILPASVQVTPTSREFVISNPSPTSTLTSYPTHLPPIVDDKGVPMALIPAGSFQMGSNDGESDEQPIHSVTLDAFYMDVYEVTNARYKACVDAGACQPPSPSDSYTRSSYFGNSQYDDYPVIYISWIDAQTYCEWRGSRLPTEAEWEKAARGGLEGKIYPWGDKAPTCTLVAQNGAQFVECSTKDTAMVGSFAPNGYGLYDMAGNVWEWLADWYGEGYYSTSPASNPTGPSSGEYRVLRGGSWYFAAWNVRAADRVGYYPDYCNSNVGFRCSR